MSQQKTPPKFSRGLSVGYQDRGMGRGDFAVIQKVGDETRLIAEIVDLGVQRRRPTAEDLNPVRENALLFAAAPELYDACADTLRELGSLSPIGFIYYHSIVARLEAAMAKATELPAPPAAEGAPEAAAPDASTDDDGDLGPDDELDLEPEGD